MVVDVDNLEFCREHLHLLTFDELSEVYNLLTVEYYDGEFVFENNIKYIETIFEIMWDYNLTQKEWENDIAEGKYTPSDEYIGIGANGFHSYNDTEVFKEFVSKKMNGEMLI